MCYRLNASIPLKIICWNLIPYVTVVGAHTAFGRWWSLPGCKFVLCKKDPRELPRPFHRERIQEYSFWDSGRGASPETKNAGPLVLYFLASKTVRNKWLLFMSHQSMTFCYSSPSRLRQHVCQKLTQGVALNFFKWLPPSHVWSSPLPWPGSTWTWALSTGLGPLEFAP